MVQKSEAVLLECSQLYNAWIHTMIFGTLHKCFVLNTPLSFALFASILHVTPPGELDPPMLA